MFETVNLLKLVEPGEPSEPSKSDNTGEIKKDILQVALNISIHQYACCDHQSH